MPLSAARWGTAALGGAGVLVAMVALAAAVAGNPPTDFDDAYMFLRYARHLLEGAGLVWNVGEPATNGATSLLHLLVVTIAAASLPGLPDGKLLQVASGAAAVAAIGALAAAAAFTVRTPVLRRHRPLVAALCACPLGFSDLFRFHAATGMDTALAVLANCGVAVAALSLERSPTGRRAVVAGLAGYVAILARPDAALYAAGAPLLAIALLTPPPRPRLAAPFLLTLGGLVLIDLAARASLLGSALPLSFHAKRPGAYALFAGEQGWNPFLFLRVFLAGALPFCLVTLVCAERSAARRLAVLLLPVVPTFAALFGMNQIMGHLGRFFYPALPFVALAAVVALDEWIGRAVAPRAGEARVLAPFRLTVRLVAAGAIALATPVVLEAAGRSHAGRAPVAPTTPPTNPSLPEVDSWRAAEEIAAIAAAAPGGAVFALSEHGLVGARAPHVKMVDMLGLHDPAFARGFSASALFARRPDLVWMPHPDHAGMLAEIYASAELWGAYDVYPDAFTFGLALRRDGAHRRVLEALVGARWQALYPGAPMTAMKNAPSDTITR